MTDSLTVISSMATKAVLAELTGAFEVQCGCKVVVESIGGVDATRRVRDGETFDLVVLASEAIDELLAARHLVADSKVDVARSQVVVAVPAGEPRPEIGSEDALRRAVLAARAIGCSTGPSGVKLVRLFEGWGIAGRLRERLVTPPPGVPVGALLARREVELGFQQASELLHFEGVDVLGPLPAPIQIVTAFSGGIGARSSRPDSARALLQFIASPAAASAKHRRGFEP